jgi:NADH dehydrogenase
VEKTGGVISQSQCTDAQRRYISRYLERRGIELRLARTVQAVEEEAVRLEPRETLPADLVYWCAGTRRADVPGLEPGAAPLRVGEALRCDDHPEVFAAGDFAATEGDSVWTNLASAQRALYHGEAAAENLVRSLDGLEARPVRYRPAGEFVALGDFDGVGVYRGLPLYGLAAAAVKKAVEARYLTELYADLPPHLLRTALGTDASSGAAGRR